MSNNETAMVHKDEFDKAFEKFSIERDLNLRLKLMKQKEEIIERVQSAIGKIPDVENSSSIRGIYRQLDGIDNKLVRNEEAHKELKQDISKTDSEIKIVKEGLKPINKIVWTVLLMMIAAIVSAIIGLVIVK